MTGSEPEEDYEILKGLIKKEIVSNEDSQQLKEQTKMLLESIA